MAFDGMGKVDLFIAYEDLTENQVSLKYNEALAAEYLSCFKKMEEKFSLALLQASHLQGALSPYSPASPGTAPVSAACAPQ